MEALLPLLQASAPGAVRALSLGAAGVIGRGIGTGIVNAAGSIWNTTSNAINSITGFGQPRSSGQQQVVMINGQPYAINQSQ